MKKISKNSKKMYDAMTYTQIKQFNELLEDCRNDNKFVQSIRDLIEKSLPESLLFGHEIEDYNLITATIAAKQFNRIYNQNILPKKEYVDIRVNGELKRITILNDNPGLYSIDGRICGDFTLVEKDQDLSLCKMSMEPNCIKINLPQNKDKFAKGLGEGVWVSVDDMTMAAYNSNTLGGMYTGSLRNDSCYFPHLKWGCTVSFEMRGRNRAVALI